MEIRKAVFPAAGLGTRFLPITKAIPKEMLPLVDKPLIQYGVEEAIQSGIREVILITGRGKGAIEEYFDVSVEFENLLREKRMMAALAEIQMLGEVRFSYTRQNEPRGLGHAILCVRNLVGQEPFAVVLGDDVLDAPVPVLAQLARVCAQHGASVIAVRRVARAEVERYGIVAGDRVAERVLRVRDLVEKPLLGEAPSDLAILGRYILTPGVFDALASTAPGRNDEIQLTDGLRGLLDDEPVYAVEVDGTCYDAGTKEGYLAANLAFALKRPDLRPVLLGLISDLLEAAAARANGPARP